MSQFSGKCDVYDVLSDTTEEHLRNSDFYIRTPDGREHHLEINNQKDLAKYYPYLTGCMYSSKDRHVVFLSSKSFIDSEEEDFINWAKDDLLKYYRKCKRTRKPYKVKEALKIARFGWNGYADYEIELAKRIEKDGEKVSIEGLHRSMHDYYRERWWEEMVRLGYTEDEADRWIYGWNEKPRREGYVEEGQSKTEEERSAEE